LWQHPDLHRSNALVASTGAARLTGLIDWQGAVVAPHKMDVRDARPAFHHGEELKIDEFRLGGHAP